MAKIKGLDVYKKYLDAKKNFKQRYLEKMKELIDEAIPVAIKAAEDATPPNVPGSGGKGTLAKAWKKDSDKESTIEGNKIYFTLGNNVYYAKWVDQGHNLTKHFVPGLHIIDGELIFDKRIKGGIIVGTQTEWVKGFYMADSAEKAFRKYIKANYDRKVKELWDQMK